MPQASSTNLTMLASGMLLVFLDVRISDVDLVPDPLGWALGAAACLGLTAAVGRARTHARLGFMAATVACVGALLPSLPDWLGGYHPANETAFAVAQTVVVFGSCTGIMALVPSRRDTANAVRWLDLATGLTLLTLLTLAGWDPASAGGAALLTGLLALGVFVWYLVLLFQSARELRLPLGQPAGASRSHDGGLPPGSGQP